MLRSGKTVNITRLSNQKSLCNAATYNNKKSGNTCRIPHMRVKKPERRPFILI